MDDLVRRLGETMVHTEAEVQIERSPEQILRWVLDLDRYKRPDHKITKVIDRPVLDASGNGVARYWGRLRGIPTPVDTNLVSLQTWEQLTFQGAPGIWTDVWGSSALAGSICPHVAGRGRRRRS